MKKQIFAAVFAALMTGVPYAAYAQEAPPPPGPGGMMMRADANHDGVVTREEMLADVDRLFARLDTNHDGKIDQAEREAAHEAMMAHRGGEGGGPGRGMGRHGDSNGDGVTTLDEQRALANRRFDMVDTNHDGKIDQAERDAMRDRMMARRGSPPADAPPPPNGN